MLTLVGCGFLGSLFAEELAKRQFAFEDSTELRLIDFDTFEERNAANQNCTLEDVKYPKVLAVKARIEKYRLRAETHEVKLDEHNMDALLDGSTLVVSALDNIKARQLLWYYGRMRKVPVLHLGVSQGGYGRVDWTHERFDSWPLSPISLIGQKHITSDVPKELKPCELIAFRGLGLNVSLAAAKAVGIWRGMDPEVDVSQNVFARTITTWEATNRGHSLTTVNTEYV